MTQDIHLLPFEVLTGVEARRRGLKKYYNGKPCIKGHHTLRVAKTGACTGCLKMQAQRARSRMSHNENGWVWVKFFVHEKDQSTLLDYVKKLTNDRLISGDY